MPAEPQSLDFMPLAIGIMERFHASGYVNRFFWERSPTEERTGWDLSERENGLNVIEKEDGETIVLYSGKKWWVRDWTNVGAVGVKEDNIKK